MIFSIFLNQESHLDYIVNLRKPINYDCNHILEKIYQIVL